MIPIPRSRLVSDAILLFDGGANAPSIERLKSAMLNLIPTDPPPVWVQVAQLIEGKSSLGRADFALEPARLEVPASLAQAMGTPAASIALIQRSTQMLRFEVNCLASPGAPHLMATRLLALACQELEWGVAHDPQLHRPFGVENAPSENIALPASQDGAGRWTITSIGMKRFGLPNFRARDLSATGTGTAGRWILACADDLVERLEQSLASGGSLPFIEVPERASYLAGERGEEVQGTLEVGAGDEPWLDVIITPKPGLFARLLGRRS